MRRTWRAQPDAAESPQWIALIDGCPWDAARPPRDRYRPSGADRFVWHVDARCGRAAREAQLPDTRGRGPWRDLVDAVRSAQKAAEPPKFAR